MVSRWRLLLLRRGWRMRLLLRPLLRLRKGRVRYLLKRGGGDRFLLPLLRLRGLRIPESHAMDPWRKNALYTLLYLHTQKKMEDTPLNVRRGLAEVRQHVRLHSPHSPICLVDTLSCGRTISDFCTIVVMSKRRRGVPGKAVVASERDALGKQSP